MIDGRQEKDITASDLLATLDGSEIAMIIKNGVLYKTGIANLISSASAAEFNKYFKGLQSWLMSYDSSLKLRGFAFTADTAPGSPTTNDAWLPQEAGTFTAYLDSGSNPVVVPTNYWQYYIKKNSDGYTVETIDSTARDKSIVIVKSKNLFDKSDITNGYFTNKTTGNLSVLAGYNASGFIEINPSTIYVLSDIYPTLTSIGACFYDENKVFISSSLTKKFSSPVNSKYIRVTVKDSDLATFQIETSDAPSNYEDFGYVFYDKDNSRKPLLSEITKLLESDQEFIKLSPNLINESRVKSDMWIKYADGSEASGSTFNATEFIQITEGLTYVLNNTVGLQQSAGWAFYNEDFSYISGGQTPSMTAPVNAKYIRITLHDDDLENPQFEVGSISSSYIRFGLYLYKNLIVDSNTGRITDLETSLKSTESFDNTDASESYTSYATTLGAAYAKKELLLAGSNINEISFQTSSITTIGTATLYLYIIDPTSNIVKQVLGTISIDVEPSSYYVIETDKTLTQSGYLGVIVSDNLSFKYGANTGVGFKYKGSTFVDKDKEVGENMFEATPGDFSTAVSFGYKYTLAGVFVSGKLSKLDQYGNAKTGFEVEPATNPKHPVQYQQIGYNVLYGKKLAGIGDSMMKGHSLTADEVYLTLVANRNGMTYTNVGINGNFVSDNGGTGTPLVNRVTDIPPDTQILVIDAGTNDAANSVTIGTETDTDITTFYGALNTFLAAAIERIPSAKICWISPYLRTAGVQAYVDAIKVACGKFSIPVFDNIKEANFYWSSTAQTELFRLADTYHFNADGHLRNSYKYEEFLRRL